MGIPLKQIKGLTKTTLTKLYIEKHLTQKQIANRFSVSHDTIQRRMELWNIKARSPKESRLRKHHYINLDKFNEISDRDSAYILGYLAWAGSKGPTSDTYIISARTSQHFCINKLSSILKLNEKLKIVHNGKHTRYELKISKIGFNKFISRWYYGHAHVKPFKFPPKMDKKYLPDYLRGYLDRHVTFLTNANRDPKYTDIFISTPYKAFTEHLIECLKTFNIFGQLKTRQQVNGHISYGIYINVRSNETLYNLLFTNKKDRGSYVEQRLKNLLEVRKEIKKYSRNT